NRIRAPNLRARRRVVGDESATERTALVLRRRASGFLERRERHVQTAVDQRRRTGNTAQRMRIAALGPDQRTGAGVHGVDVALQIAEVDRLPRLCACTNRADAE